MRHRLVAIFTLSLLPALAASLAAADPLDAIFAGIDAAAKTFKGMTANISSTQYTALVDDKDVQTGTIKLSRVSAGVTRALVELHGVNGDQSFALDAHVVRIYHPKTNVVDEIDITSRQALVNQYLLLGFGATSAELKSTYDITSVGDEKIGGQQTTHLLLVPKSPETRRTLKQADLWFGSNGLVAQQKFLRVSGDYTLATYFNIKPGPLTGKDLDLKLKPGATIQKDRQ